jgi:hypothetical protein
VLSVDHVAIDLYVEEVIQFGGLYNGRAVLARGDDGDFEPLMAELMDEFNASLVRLHPFVFDDFVDQVVPRPSTVSACGGSSGLPWGSWMPRDVRKSRTPS